MKKTNAYVCCALFAMGLIAPLQAHAFFEDDEARRHILDVRSKLNDKADTAALIKVAGQVDALREEVAGLRNQIEELNNQVQQLQSQQKDFYVDIDERLKKLEPNQPQSEDAGATTKTTAEDSQAELKAYEQAQAKFQARDYKQSVVLYNQFIKQYPQSHLLADAYYNSGNALYLQGNYKEARKQQQVVLKRFSKNPVAPQAMMNLAMCDVALNDVAGGKKTLQELVKKYPSSAEATRAKKLLTQL